METLAEFSLPAPLRHTLANLARVILTEEVDTLGIKDDVVDGVELFLRSIPAPMRVALVAGLHTFNQSARVAPSSFGRSFASLPPEKAAAHFERWWSSPVPGFHDLAKALRMFLTFSAYEHPVMKAKLGYDPEVWIAKVTKDRVDRFADDIAAHEALMTEPDPLVARRGPTTLPVAEEASHGAS